MAPHKTKRIKSSLISKGFVVSESDHTMLFLHINDKKTSIFTKISHGESEYGDGLLKKMKKQLRLENRQQLDDLINCPMGYEEYITILVKNNQIKISIAPQIAIKSEK